MAVYERKYRSYEGEQTPTWSRFLVLPRYSFEQVFKSRLFLIVIVLCAIPTLIFAAGIYLPNNSRIPELFTGIVEFLNEMTDNYGGSYFRSYMWWQTLASMIIVFLIGPKLIATDLSNNGLPLYLARPFTRVEYVLGKSAVLLFILSALTWIPGMALFFLQFTFGGMSWLRQNLQTGIAIMVSSVIVLLTLNLVTLAISATFRGTLVARLMLLILFVVFWVVSTVFVGLSGSGYGALISVPALMDRVIDSLFGVEPTMELPLVVAIFGLGGICLLFLYVLHRKLRAYEVV